MRGRYREMQHGRRENDKRRVQICRKTIDRLHAEDLISDSTDDTPATDTGTSTHRRRACHFDFPRHLERSDIAARQQCQRDDAHRLLRIIRAMRKRHECCRCHLYVTGNVIHARLPYISKKNIEERHDEIAHAKSNDRRADEADDDRQHPGKMDRACAVRDDDCTDDAADQCMR